MTITSTWNWKRPFEAGYRRAMVPIPIHIWESIRHLGGAQMDLADKQDNELLAMVETEVDQRIAEISTGLERNTELCGVYPHLRLLGLWHDGLAAGRSDPQRYGIFPAQATTTLLDYLKAGDTIDEFLRGLSYGDARACRSVP